MRSVNPNSTNRRGTTIVECAITLPVLFIVLFAMLDLGIAAARYNFLVEASRRIAREVVLHGSLAPTSSGTWGPAAYSGTSADGSAMITPAIDMIPTMVPGDVNVNVTWPDSDNSLRDRVQVEVAYEHQPLVPLICQWGTLYLRSVTTMHIVN
jgi:Flp pilus assembly protein TadG